MASISGATLAISGSGFGTRSQAAPLHFDNFDSRSVGARPADFGYHNYGGFGGSVTVDASTAFSGTRALRHQSDFGTPGTDVRESFPHIAIRGFSGTELYLSYRLKFATNGSRIAQLKFNRSGMEVSTANGSPCYGGSPKFRSSYYPEGPSNGTASDKTLRYVQGGIVRHDESVLEGWIGETGGFEGTPLAIPENTWVQVEEYYRLNDIGAANGEFVTYVNGHRHFNHHNLLLRSSANQVLNCSYLVVGMDYYVNAGSTNGVTVWYDDHYLDTSRARLVLANAATWDQATIRSPQPATQWSASSIAAPLQAAGFAAGSDAWLYVVRADGVVSTAKPIRLP